MGHGRSDGRVAVVQRPRPRVEPTLKSTMSAAGLAQDAVVVERIVPLQLSTPGVAMEAPRHDDRLDVLRPVVVAHDRAIELALATRRPRLVRVAEVVPEYGFRSVARSSPYELGMITSPARRAPACRCSDPTSSDTSGVFRVFQLVVEDRVALHEDGELSVKDPAEIKLPGPA